MSSRERMLSALRREGTEYVPMSLLLCQGPKWPEPFLWHNQFERARRMLDMGLDPTIDIWLPDMQPHPDARLRTWREHEKGCAVLTKEYHTPAGVLRSTIRETGDWCDATHARWTCTTLGTGARETYGLDLCDDHNVSRRLEPWVKGQDDVEKLRYIVRVPEGYVLDEWRMDAERAMEFARKYDLLTVARRTIVGEAFQWLCDIQWFASQLYEDPEFVEGFLDVFHQWSKALLELAFDVGVDVIQYRGCYESPMFWGLEAFRRYLVPRINEQANLVHQANRLLAYLLLEGHGTYAQILKDTHIDVLQGVDPVNLGRGTLRSFFDEIGGTKAIWGGIAPLTLQSVDRAAIYREVRQAIETLAAHGGLVLSGYLFSGIPIEGVLCAVEAWRDHRHLSALPAPGEAIP